MVEKFAPPCWKFYHECPMGSLGLIPARNLRCSLSDGTVIDIGALRPDTVAVCQELRKIAIIDFCRPFDGEEAQEAVERGDACGVSTDGAVPGHPARTRVDPGSIPPRSNSQDEQTIGDDDGGTQHANPYTRHAGGAQLNDAGVGLTRARIRRAGERKCVKYQAIVDALYTLINEGWRIEVLPWVVGVRCVLDTTAINKATGFHPQRHLPALRLSSGKQR